MAEILLFHHAQGLTEGVLSFADRLREAGHQVTTPDLYDGTTYATLDEGLAHIERIGFDEVVAAGVAHAEPLPAEMVYAGFSLGVVPAQKLTQNRPGARAALLYHSGIPAAELGAGWPAGVPLQVHVAEEDELGEVPLAEELVRDAGADGELFLYPGSAHLFTDSSLAAYDEEATALVLERTLDLLRRWP